MLTVNNPNRQMVLERNPNFHGETIRSRARPAMREGRAARDAGQRCRSSTRRLQPEKETIPYWNKFLQGYYDMSGILRQLRSGRADRLRRRGHAHRAR
jgi:oligopeptide transport system substrate-binding protein